MFHKNEKDKQGLNVKLLDNILLLYSLVFKQFTWWISWKQPSWQQPSFHQPSLVRPSWQPSLVQPSWKQQLSLGQRLSLLVLLKIKVSKLFDNVFI